MTQLYTVGDDDDDDDDDDDVYSLDNDIVSLVNGRLIEERKVRDCCLTFCICNLYNDIL